MKIENWDLEIISLNSFFITARLLFFLDFLERLCYNENIIGRNRPFCICLNSNF